jgi:hypothetical protein
VKSDHRERCLVVDGFDVPARLLGVPQDLYLTCVFFFPAEDSRVPVGAFSFKRDFQQRRKSTK